MIYSLVGSVTQLLYLFHNHIQPNIHMSTLADTFLDDLDDLGDADEESVSDEQNDEGKRSKSNLSKALDEFGDSDDEGSEDGDEDEIEGGKAAVISPELQVLIGKIRKGMSIESIITVRNSVRYKTLMAEIAAESATGRDTVDRGGPHEENREYKMMVASNKMVQDINEEFEYLHRYIRIYRLLIV